MDKSIFKIYYQNKIGTCFLCAIPSSNSFHLIPVLITCHHNLDNKFIGNTIKLVNDEKEIIILIDESRRIYKNEEYDIIIIELKENEFNNEDFLKVDEDVYKGNILQKGNPIYIIHYPKEPRHSEGELVIMKDNLILHRCDTDKGSSGSPILNLNSFQVIGIHIGYHQKNNVNIGKVIKFPIDEFNKLNNKKDYENNEITLKAINDAHKIKENSCFNSLNNNNGSQKECGICGENIDYSDSYKVKASCGHIFCLECWKCYLQVKLMI